MKRIMFALSALLISVAGSSQNPLLLKDVFPGNNTGTIQQIVKTSNYTFFNEDDDDADTDKSLFRTDGTIAGTIKLNLTYPEYISTKAEKLTALGNKVIFAGDNNQGYGEIWASDGTQAGTVALERFLPNSNKVPVVEISAMGSYAYYSVINKDAGGINHAYLRRTDGTAGGTSLVYDFSAFTGVPQAVFLTPVNNILYFIVYDAEGTGVDQLWRSDGTAAGTYMVYNFTTANFVESFIMPVGNTLYLMIGSVVGGVRQNTIWKSDGTAAGTVPVKLIGTGNTNTYPPFLAIGNNLVFAGLDGNGKELWVTDGTAAGTNMVADINSGAGSSNPANFTFLNNVLYFSAINASTGNELWKSDGTAAGTLLVKDIYPGTSSSNPAFIVESNGSLLFRAANDPTGNELWISDGTAANTKIAVDLNPLGASNPNLLTTGNPVYFAANNGTSGFEVFKYDNTDGIAGVRKFYVNDNSTSGDVFTTSIGNNINPGTRTAPVATISYAVSIALPGDTILVDAGTYTEQITLDKNITIAGAGQNLTSILKPAVTVAPPGSFTEQGVIQTSQSISGDVHIRNLSVTGGLNPGVTPIIIQSGGSVKNCTLQNGNQGIFVRIDPTINPATKTFVVDGNTINAEYIAVNFAGTRLSATLTNNTITAFNPSFSAGMYSGDFGRLSGLTVTGNTIGSYVTTGLLVSTESGTITQNSFTGSGSQAINNNGGTTINATCNWYGSPLAATVASKIIGQVNYSPWLIDGTDNSPAVGFQNSGTCSNANSFYVNDNSTSGDVFTTAIGNNANPGTSTAPYATLEYAITQVPTGATIFVDAGTYALASSLTINKSITILGSNYLISPNDAIIKANYNSSRNAETRFTGAALLIGADNIYLKGLKFSPTASAVSQNGNFSHVKIEKTYFDVIGTGNIVNLQGSSSNPVVAFDFSITDNRFERTDILAGNSINLGLVKSIWIDNNVFIESPATGNPFRGAAVRTVGGQSVESTVFSNNYVKKLNVGVVPQMIQDWIVNNNVFDSCNTGYNHTPANTVSNNIFIRTNTFTNTRVGRSILVRGGTNGGVNNLNIIDNTLNQEVDGINGVVSMIQLDFAVGNNNGTVTVTANKLNLSGNYDNAFFKTQCGIMLMGKHNNTTVSYNELNFTAINQIFNPSTFLPSVPTGIYINTDGGTGSGPIPAGSIINITNNKINGFKSSIGLYDPTSTGLTPEVGYGYLTAGAQVNIHDNSFVNDSMSIDNGAISENINTSCNFYNTNIPEILITKISPETGDYLPWLVNGTDNEPLTTGFQPVAGSCTGRVNKWYVNDAMTDGDVFTTKAGDDVLGYGLSTSPFATISRALTEAQAGDSIFVDAGTYAMVDFTIPQGITILGTNYQLSPNDATDKRNPNTTRNAESIVTGATFSIGGSNVSIQGMTIDPGPNVGIFLNAVNYSNLSVLKNRFKTNSNQPGVIFRAAGTGSISVASLVGTGYTVADNRFEKYDANNSNTIVADRIKNLSISDNTFVVVGANLRTYTAVVLGNNGVTDSVLFSNNTIDNANGGIGGARVAGGVFTGNKIYNTNTAFNLNNSIPESSTIEFSNNILDGSAGILPFVIYSRFGGNGSGSSSLFKSENNTSAVNAMAGITSLLGNYNINFTNTVLNPSVIIRGNKMDFGGNLSTVEGQLLRPIVIRGKQANTIIENNELTLSGINLQPKNPSNILPVCPAISLYSDIGTGAVLPSNAVINILNNKINGFKQSFVVFDPTNSAGGGLNDYTGYGNLPTGVSVNINNNSFTGDSISINNGSIGQTVKANCNWYGSASAQNFINKLSLSTVDIVPWLTNGTDNDATTGFQPVPNSCGGYPTLITLDTTSEVTCNGANNGTINITTSYGKAPFTFTWTKEGDANFVSNNEDLTGLAPGTYRLAIVDGNGSTIYITDPEANGPGIITVTITEPSILTASTGGGNVSCYGGTNGSASVTAIGGTAPYTYLWSNSETLSAITNLAAGTYSVTVTDDNGCTTTASYEVTQPALLTASITNNSTACSNNATVTAGGGTAPYSYLWSNGSASSSITGVIAATYSVTVTDAKGCTTTASITLTVSGAFNPTAAVTDVTCFGANNGIITVTNANGTAPFTFSIDGVNFLQGAFPYSFTNLAPGTYTVAARDVNGCTGFVTRTIIQPPQLVVTLNTVQSTCFGQNTGSVSVTTSGGTGALSYSWTGVGGFSSSQKNISGLATGNYSLTVTDKNGCTSVLNVFVPSLPQITVNSTVNNIACKGEFNGSIILNVTGGTGNFSYLWNTGATTNSITNLGTGNYTVTVTDIGSGCVVSKSFTITQPSTVVGLSTSKTNATGCASLGTITATGSGGTSPYQYSLDGINYQASGLFTGLYAGSYIVRVKDFNGCIKTSAALSITDNGLDEYDGSGSNKNNTKSKAASIPVGITIAGRIATTGDPEDWYKFTVTAAGNYTLSLTHPSASFAYNLFTLNNTTAIGTVASTGTSKTYSLAAGDYYIQVTGGLSYVCYSLAVSSGIGARISTGTGPVNNAPVVITSTVLKARTYPNPHSGSFILNIESPENGNAKVELFTITGQKLVERTVLLQKGENNLVPFKGISKGTVLYRVQIGKNVATGKVIGIE